MKRFLLIIPALVLLMAGCHPDPNASFMVSSHRVQVFESVDFTNTSSDIPGTLRMGFWGWNLCKGNSCHPFL